MSATPVPDPEAIEARLRHLAEYVDDDYQGWTRVVLSDPYRASRDWIRSAMREAGLEVRLDGAGNIVGRLPGRNAHLKPVMTGSHTDTVVSGGRFDGIVGVVGAIEVASLLRESGTSLERDLYVVDFFGEEANRFGTSCLGSRAMVGGLTRSHLDLTDADGRKLGTDLEQFGVDPGAAVAQAWPEDSLHAYVELHVEQGPRLERGGTDIGVVTAITGITRVLATFTGRTDHAGTMPMADRQDALASAAAAVLAVEREGCGAPAGGVATVGRVDASPGIVSAVPGEARVWAELRSTDAGWLGQAHRNLVDQIGREADSRGVSAVLDWLNEGAPVPTSPTIRDHIARASEGRGLSWQAVPSGAGHDAAHLAALGPMGMIFVPSAAGRSHCPEEFTATEQINRGVQVLLDTLVSLDAETGALA